MSYPRCHRAHSSRSRCPARWEEQHGRAVYHLSPPDLTATDRNCWGIGQHGDLWSSQAEGEEREIEIHRVNKWINQSPVSRAKQHIFLNPLTGSCSSNNRLTTTMLMSVPMVPSLKRLETCKCVEKRLVIFHLSNRILISFLIVQCKATFNLRKKKLWFEQCKHFHT